MVRKWSYIESNDVGLNSRNLLNISRLYNFKVFRKTTRFKKFNRGITCMVRKNYARRKHRTNWLIMSYITKSWVLNYLKARQFERFYSALGRFTFNVFSADVNVFYTKLSTISNFDGINIVSCSKTTTGRHINYSPGANFLKNPLKNTNSTLIQTSNTGSIVTSIELYPNLVNLDNLLYAYDELDTLTTQDTYTRLYQTLGSVIFSNNVQFQLDVYLVLSKLTIFNTTRN